MLAKPSCRGDQRLVVAAVDRCPSSFIYRYPALLFFEEPLHLLARRAESEHAEVVLARHALNVVLLDHAHRLLTAASAHTL